MYLGTHPNTETIELYLNPRKPAAAGNYQVVQDYPSVEEHLLVCERCLEIAKREHSISSLIRRSLILHTPYLTRRRNEEDGATFPVFL